MGATENAGVDNAVLDSMAGKRGSCRQHTNLITANQNSNVPMYEQVCPIQFI